MEHPQNGLHFLVKSVMLDRRVAMKPRFAREVLTLVVLATFPRRLYRWLRSRYGPDSAPRDAPLLTMP
jgi:hypothetical protein